MVKNTAVTNTGVKKNIFITCHMHTILVIFFVLIKYINIRLSPMRFGYIFLLILSINFNNISMSTQQEAPPGQYQPTFSHLLPINDYEQTVESPQQQTPWRQELPLEQIEQILSQSSTITNRREIVLILAINYLQQRCGELTNSNNYLQLRHKDLMEEINYLNEVQINQETAHNFLQIMQKQIESYKFEFHLYRERYLSLKKTMFEENATLNAQIQDLEASLAKNQAQRQDLEEERNDILASNDELLEINANLNDKIEDLQSQLSTLRNQSKYGNGSRTYGNRKLDSQIQAQLQSLIEKLMLQLQNERNLKTKISSECKHLQRQLIQFQKELTEKNSKIYQLEMISIKSNRLSPQNIKSNKVRQIYENNNYKYYQNNTHKERNGNDISKRLQSTKRQNENSNFKTFSLMTLLNQDADFTKKTRLIIALKVIEFYLRKIKKGEYTTQMLQNLLVYNYSSLYPQACIIRKDKSMVSNEGECSQERLIWNLGFILDNLINQAQDEPQQKTGAEIELINLINNILQQNACNLQDVDELKALAQEAIKLKK